LTPDDLARDVCAEIRSARGDRIFPPGIDFWREIEERRGEIAPIFPDKQPFRSFALTEKTIGRHDALAVNNLRQLG